MDASRPDLPTSSTVDKSAPARGGRRLDDLRFTNSFVNELPADPDERVVSRQVLGAAYSRVQPTPTSAPSLLSVSTDMLDELGLDHAVADTEQFTRVVTGNELLPGSDPYAMAYGGHQFGNWAGQLGDGRAIALGEIETDAGERWTLQLKGAGRTPYSRGADGLAVLRSSVREYLCSEAMHALGVPTTRALSLALTGDKVVRDMFYDGRPEAELGAVVCRVAPSFLRFGNYQLPASRGELDLLRALLDHTIERHEPDLTPATPDDSAAAYTALFARVSDRTADLMVEWMRVGFVHGVMNTDNLSILGLTIDYGPYGWLEDFDPSWTPNTTDAQHRRYRFGQQPQIAHWNLAQLGAALLPLIGDVEPLQAALDSFVDRYQAGYQQMMAAKLGLPSFDPATDDALIEGVVAVLQSAETDMTIFYRRLADVDLDAEGDQRFTPLLDAYYQPEQLTDDVRAGIDAWLDALAERLASLGDTAPSAADRRAAMNAVNPKYVLRNYLAQLAIDAAEAGDASKIAELLDTLRHPYDEQPAMEHLAAKRPDWARTRPGCSMLSCSS
ncbi:MAG: YdiU family protein [Acidimicrobiales bacterium]